MPIRKIGGKVVTMLDFKKNAETGSKEIRSFTMNVHPMIVNEKGFTDWFDYAQCVYQTARLGVLTLNSVELTENDKIWLEYLMNEGITIPSTEKQLNALCSPIADLPNELRLLGLYTLSAHGILFEGCNEKDGKYSIKTINFTASLADFYKKSAETVRNIRTGQSLDDAVRGFKDDFGAFLHCLDHAPVEGVCKHWEVTVRNKTVKAFLEGCLGTSKLTKSNLLKRVSPIDTQKAFERYALMFLVTNGQYVLAKKSKGGIETADSVINRLCK